MCALPIPSMAKEGNLSNQNEKIETPQTRLSPEIKIGSTKGTRPLHWITEHKWWVLSGVSVLTAGLILLNKSDDSGNDINNNTNDGGDNGYGQISGKW